MLEMLLMQYKDMFGVDFPLKNFTESREIDVINILYDCVLSNTPYKAGQEPEGRITDAPGLNVERDREGL
jgi:hypothetical protein